MKDIIEEQFEENLDNFIFEETKLGLWEVERIGGEKSHCHIIIISKKKSLY